MPSFGGTVKLTGESEYRKALREITSNLKEVSSELKLTNTQFNSGEKTIKETKSSYNNMNTTLTQQREKVNSLREALEKAEKEYGSNHEKVKMFKTQLNNAESELVKMEKETNKSNKELKNMKNSFEGAGSGALKLGDIIKANLISEGIIAGVKKLAEAMKQVASVAIDVVKKSVTARGEIEQSIGGVETLFKDSANTVIENANNAYKTSGLSANEYMQNVTSFSASLLQSVSNDTDKAAKIADMAMIDMSDNANKMGTDMSSIQSAYQGFAKQNYTMLDNLKLGYGGTKTEMERLLKDAQKITGVKYDIKNLSDVYEAIHVIQGELGIAGTTAKEATETLQGSTLAMQSAWSNFLSGSGGLGDVLETAKTFAGNLVRILNDAIPDIIENLVDWAPDIVEAGIELMSSFIKGLGENFKYISEFPLDIITTLIDGFTSNLPQLISIGLNVMVTLAQGLAQSLPTLIPSIVDAVILIVETLIDNIDMVIDAGIQLILGLADGLIEALPRLIEKAPEIIQKLVDALIRNFPKIVQAGGELIGKLVSGLSGSLFKLMEVAPKIVSSIVNGIKSLWGEMKNVGNYLVEGLWKGISGMADWVKDKVKSFAKNIVGNIKEALGIHSPSTILRDEVGKFMAKGIGLGFSDEMKDVTEQMQSAIPTKFNIETEGNIKDSSNNKIDTLLDMLENYLPRIITASNKQLVLDTGVLIGATADRYNSALGNIQVREMRGS